MKIFLAAIAMAIAVPAAAQTAQPAHAEHADHDQQGDHKGHDGAMKCCEGMHDGKMECCDKAKADGAKMECCDKHAKKAGTADPHAGHDMGKH